MALGFLYGSGGGGASIPEGSTVLPVGDAYTWQLCAAIKNPQYTTINEILADATTLAHCIGSANATDYLVRSTTFASEICANATAMSLIGASNYASDTLLADSDWCEAICESQYFGSVLNDTVPAMTSATTPSGSVTASNYATGSDPYKAFDGSASTIWNTQDSTTAVTRTITYAFAGTCKALVTTFEARNSSDLPYSPSSVTVKGSNDNSNWTTLATFNISNVSNKSIISTPAAYKYYRCDCVAKLYSGSNKYMCRAAEIQFYGRKDV